MKRAEDISRKRKKRSDRKREIQPVISVELYDCIARISYITTTPIKNVGETLYMEGFRSQKVIDQLSPFFRRDFRYSNQYGDIIIIPGDTDRIPFKINRGDGIRARISMRFHQDNHDKISELAFTLDMTVSSAAALLLETAFSLDIGLDYIQGYIVKSLDANRLEQLEAVLQFMNEQNHPDQRITMTDLLDFLAGEAYERFKRLEYYLCEWIDQYSEYI
ncbi:hypothetical protein [Ammoniphilus sp. 3BR4]|uniref:hypothetical protein n=1 Tax=Ammoniphilus sp. 3BR4 TaxID=3158265 RepID=UPI003465ACE4